MTSKLIDTTFLRRCVQTLERAYVQLNKLPSADDPDYELYRAASVKEFELVLAQGGKLLPKRIAAYFASGKEVARLTYKDLFRYASRHDLIDITTTVTKQSMTMEKVLLNPLCCYCRTSLQTQKSWQI